MRHALCRGIRNCKENHQVKKIVVADSKGWFLSSVKTNSYKKLNIIEIRTKEELSMEYLKEINPNIIFFPHWSWQVKKDIVDQFDCILFHTAPLPFGRGGSPIQNLIIRGFKESPVCAVKMTEKLDSGPIYLRKIVSLEGNLREIFNRISTEIENMIILISAGEFNIPKEQIGDGFNFTRLGRADNAIDISLTIEEIYDRIRMVDGFDYPRAYLTLDDKVIEFTNATIDTAKVCANATISLQRGKVEQSIDKNRAEELIFLPVESTQEHKRILYDLLCNRKYNISNIIKPSYEEHSQFIEAHPYIAWYILKTKNGTPIGDAYVMESNCVGINLIEDKSYLISKAINFIKLAHRPLSPIKSVRPANFFINISPDNSRKIQALEKAGYNRLQLTYTI